jgi:hypothetical protein
MSFMLEIVGKLAISFEMLASDKASTNYCYTNFELNKHSRRIEKTSIRSASSCGMLSIPFRTVYLVPRSYIIDYNAFTVHVSMSDTFWM